MRPDEDRIERQRAGQPSHHPADRRIAELSAAVREQFPDIAILGEYFTDQVTLEKTVPEWGINLLIGNSWENPFGPQLRNYIQELKKCGYPNVSGYIWYTKTNKRVKI